jgi:hypothetical protein
MLLLHFFSINYLLLLALTFTAIEFSSGNILMKRAAVSNLTDQEKRDAAYLKRAGISSSSSAAETFEAGRVQQKEQKRLAEKARQLAIRDSKKQKSDAEKRNEKIIEERKRKTDAEADAEEPPPFRELSFTTAPKRDNKRLNSSSSAAPMPSSTIPFSGSEFSSDLFMPKRRAVTQAEKDVAYNERLNSSFSAAPMLSSTQISDAAASSSTSDKKERKRLANKTYKDRIKELNKRPYADKRLLARLLFRKSRGILF